MWWRWPVRPATKRALDAERAEQDVNQLRRVAQEQIAALRRAIEESSKEQIRDGQNGLES